MKIAHSKINPDKVVNVRQAEQEKKLQHLGRTKLHKGQKMWEYNIADGTMEEAKFEEDVASFPQEVKGKSPRAHFERLDNMIINPIVRKVIVNENCLYVPAINKKTAIKKLLKRYKK